MTAVERTITVRSSREFGRRPPPGPTGDLLRAVESMARDSVLMGFRGRSASVGRPPRWLEAATDIRFTGISGETTTDFHFEAPTLGEAAAEIYEQREFWSQKPNPDWTALDLLRPIVAEISRRNPDSDAYDGPLLRHVAGFSRAVRAGFDEIYPPGEEAKGTGSRIDADTVAAANELRIETPAPRQVRIVGVLDMLRASTQTIGLRLDNGDEIRGVLADSVQPLTERLEKRVVLLGRAVYRPSGKLLRVDVDSWEAGDTEPSLFSRIPSPLLRAAREPDNLKPQTPRGVAVFFGTWPGEETEGQLLEALRSLP